MKESELDLVSEFISKHNREDHTHIGFCGEEVESIKHDMKSELDLAYTESFLVTYDEDQLVGVLGFDADFSNKNAEVWGPFIKDGYEEWRHKLWKGMLSYIPDGIDSLELFPNHQNEVVNQLAREADFQKHSEQLILTYSEVEDASNTDHNELSAEQHHNFITLHDQEFPKTYYNGAQIIERMNEHRKVFVKLNEEGQLIGYIYVEVEPEVSDASIEFFAVDPSERGKGIGKQLMKEALAWMLSFEEINSVALCVNAKDEGAIGLYLKSGFERKHQLVCYMKSLKGKG